MPTTSSPTSRTRWTRFEQPSAGAGTRHRLSQVSDDYHARLSLMEEYYEGFVSDSDRERTLLDDYAPHADFLGSLGGRVLDVGGGAGLAARFLPRSTSYVVVDPASVWKSPEWVDFGAAFRRDGPEPIFIEAGGEELPFPDADFDAVLSFWSLNHVEDPARCLSEMLRVLKPAGRARLVLEDTKPKWLDLLIDGLGRSWSLLTGRKRIARVPRGVVTAASQKWRGKWEVADDHILVPERDVRMWVAERARIDRREWLHGYLTLDLYKLGTKSTPQITANR